MPEKGQMTKAVKKGDVVVVSFLVGHVGIDTEHRLRQELQEHTKEAPKPQVLIDLADVSYVSSGPLGVLTAFERQVSEREGKLAFCAVSPYVLETFRAAGLLRLFDVYENCEEALASFPPGPEGTVPG
jgi:anti-anti-sigma factor